MMRLSFRVPLPVERRPQALLPVRLITWILSSKPAPRATPVSAIPPPFDPKEQTNAPVHHGRDRRDCGGLLPASNGCTGDPIALAQGNPGENCDHICRVHVVSRYRNAHARDLQPGKPSPTEGRAPSTFSTSYVRPDKFIFDYPIWFGTAPSSPSSGPQKKVPGSGGISQTALKLPNRSHRRPWARGEIPDLLLRGYEAPARVAPFSQLKDLALVGTIKIDDSECYLIEGLMAAINFQSGKPFEVVYSYAIDKTSFLIRRIQMEMIGVELRSKSTTDYKPQINIDISEKTFTFNPPASATAGPPGTQAGVQSSFMPQPPIPQAPETRPEYLTPERRTKNLLKNGSFESGTEPWLLQSWRQVLDGATVVESPVHDGTHSVRLQGKTDDVTYRQRVNLQPNHRYLGSGWIKTENVVINEANGTHGELVHRRRQRTKRFVHWHWRLDIRHVRFRRRRPKSGRGLCATRTSLQHVEWNGLV